MILRRVLALLTAVVAVLVLTAGAAQACWYLDCVEHERGMECNWYWH